MTALAEPPPRRPAAAPPAIRPVPRPAVPPAGDLAPPVRAVLSAADSLLLRGVSWGTYVALRDDPENDGLRMTFDRGSLEIMTQSLPHESFSVLLYSFVQDWCIARGVPFQAGGQLTMQRELLLRGLEPDHCFFIRSVQRMRGRDGWDADRDPPPDLAVEVVVSNPAVPKLPIYAALGVPEVWVWEDETLTVRRLDGDRYATAADSGELAGFPLATAADLLRRADERVTSELVAEFRTAVRASPPATDA